MYEFGQGVKVNYQMAKKLYEQACKQNRGITCTNLNRLKAIGVD